MTAKVLYREDYHAICQSDIHGRFILRVGACGEGIYLYKQRVAFKTKISVFPPSKNKTISNEYDIVQEDLDMAEGILTAISLTKQIPNIQVDKDKQIAIINQSVA